LLLTEVRATSKSVPPLPPATTIFPTLWSTMDVMNASALLPKLVVTRPPFPNVESSFPLPM
jgi:hypothetical protein